MKRAELGSRQVLGTSGSAWITAALWHASVNCYLLLVRGRAKLCERGEVGFPPVFLALWYGCKIIHWQQVHLNGWAS